MAVKTTSTDYTKHVTEIRAHSTNHADTGLRTMNKSDFHKMVESLDGVTPEVLEAVSTSQERVIGAAITVATEDLKERISAARDAGDDTSTLKNILRISTPGGSTEIAVRATRTRPNPKTGEPVTKHGVVSVDIDANKRIPSEAADHAKTVITKALGINSP